MTSSRAKLQPIATKQKSKLKPEDGGQTLYRYGDGYVLAENGKWPDYAPKSVQHLTERQAKALVWKWVSTSRGAYREETSPADLRRAMLKAIDGGRKAAK